MLALNHICLYKLVNSIACNSVFFLKKKFTLRAPPRMFQIAIGSYEAPLYGYEAGIRKADASDEFRFVMAQLFAYVPHTGCIRSLGASGRWLVSSSTDESLKCAFIHKLLPMIN